ncbi:MAG: RNA-binding protein [Nannocystaceae bacterium]
MAKKIFIGELSGVTTQAGLESAFSSYGTIERAYINTDPASGAKSGNVDYTTDAAGDAAIAGMNGAVLDGVTLVVRPA